MKIDNKSYSFQEISRTLTVPDCNVIGPNKIGSGHGEGKFYFGSKPQLNSFTMGNSTIECFFLKDDLLTYMQSAYTEYHSPTQEYAGKQEMPRLWSERITQIDALPSVIRFTANVQNQIEGSRGYLNSNDSVYNLFRKIALPLISYVSIMRLKDANGHFVFYWKLFVDYLAMEMKGTPQVFTYGKGGKPKPSAKKDIVKAENTESAIKTGRDAAKQAKYRSQLLEECPFCPITKISDERILLASHIKPWSVSEPSEEYDPKNGFILSPLYDNLFDQGFISFDDKKCMLVSNWISPDNQKRCQIKAGAFIQSLPLDEKREAYLQYHRKFVFKG